MLLSTVSASSRFENSVLGQQERQCFQLYPRKRTALLIIKGEKWAADYEETLFNLKDIGRPDKLLALDLSLTTMPHSLQGTLWDASTTTSSKRSAALHWSA